MSDLHDDLSTRFAAVDSKSTGIITFDQLNLVLAQSGIQMTQSSVEYVVYIMKNFSKGNDSFNLLNYREFLTRIKPNKAIEVTAKEFEKIYETLMYDLANLLKRNKKSLREMFGNIVFVHEVAELKVSYEAVKLKSFVENLFEAGLTLSEMQINCLFKKMRVSPDFETIDFKKVEAEMGNYGIFDKETIREEDESAEQLKTILDAKTLRELPVFAELAAKIKRVAFDEGSFDCLDFEEFVKFLRKKGICANTMFLEDNKERLTFKQSPDMLVLDKLYEFVKA